MLREKQNASQTFNDCLWERKRKIHNPGSKVIFKKNYEKAKVKNSHDNTYQLRNIANIKAVWQEPQKSDKIHFPCDHLPEIEKEEWISKGVPYAGNKKTTKKKTKKKTKTQTPR